ncbi:PAS domain-containing protein [Methylobacterium sp.]|uniref:PAS domain-containing protein n=1 Tax=Methylobacterium sp. TaxID=409 RepID=UPI003B000FB9
MPRKSPESALWSRSLTLAAPSIGVWETDLEADLTRGDAVVARLFGWSEAEAEEGVPISRFLSAIHPDDLAQGQERRRRIREEGGVFVWEHRVVPAPGVVRWVLARGQFWRDANGRMFGRGIVIDVTDSRRDGHTDGPARFLTTPEVSGPLLESIAERALEIEEIGRGLDDETARQVRPLIEGLLYELGRQISASLAEDPTPERPSDQTMH